ncbi:MAG: hypothetical protein E6J79_02935 [Deltaproteobacteria bacterium]|nr:MAG: hypothetical protein E6J79_02935 [Deltaproteobacteria bacterium]
MTFIVLFWLNVALLAVFAVILMRPQLLGYAKGGKWYLTWLSIGVITLMDELTSVFYAPAEAHRFIGMKAIFFIAFTSLIMRVLSTRMVEISEILELHGLRGGGVYSFSYFVLGPVASFVAVASKRRSSPSGRVPNACSCWASSGPSPGSTSSASARTRASRSPSSWPRPSCS